MPDSEPACLALRLPLALLGLACAWQINHKMALWFNATSAPPDPVNSAASVPETPGPPAPAAKKQKTQAKAGRPSNLTAFNKKNADMIGRGDITRYLTTIPAATPAAAARAAAAQAAAPAAAAGDAGDEVMQRFESGRNTVQDLDLHIYRQAGAVSILDVGKAVDDPRWLVDGIPLRKGYRVRVKFTGERHALHGMVVEARVGATVSEDQYDGSPLWSAVIFPASQILAAEKRYMLDSFGNSTITGVVGQPKNGIRSSPRSLFEAIEQRVAEALSVPAPTGLHLNATAREAKRKMTRFTADQVQLLVECFDNENRMSDTAVKKAFEKRFVDDFDLILKERCVFLIFRHSFGLISDRFG